MKRSTTLLIGIGLVLVGLLSGIFLMLYFDRGQPMEQPPRVVERVELGQQNGPASPTRPDVELADSTLAPPALQTALLNNRFKDVAGRVTPSVVYIQVDMPGQDGLHEFDDRSPEFFRGPRRSVGSGVIVSENGYIVTNHHVIEGARNIEVTLADKRQFEAEVVGTDASTDLAVIRIDARDLPAIALGDSDVVEVGEWVIAVGNPFRLTSTVTAGIVGALGRQVNIIEDSFGIEDFIQTDAAISPGNSGGALVNLEGELVGINTAIASRSGSYEGYGFAVPSNLMQRVVGDLIEYGRVNRGFMGVSIQEVNAQTARELGLNRISGVLISEAQRNGPAHEAGLREGDVVLSIAGQAVDAPNELQSVVARKRPGDQIGVQVWRRGNVREFEIQLGGQDEDWLAELRRQPEQRFEQGPRTQPDERLFELAEWGIGLRAPTAGERSRFEEPDGGVYLAYVARGSVADEAGLPRDVLVSHIDDVPVASVEDVMRRLGSTEEVALFQVVQPNGISAFYEVEAP